MRQNFSLPTTKVKWVLLFSLAIVWGSSFILMKKALVLFPPIQLGSLRLIICTLVLAFMGNKYIRLVRRADIGLYLFSGFFGNFLPAFLFAFTQSGLSSSITGMLNALVPVFTLLMAITIFKHSAHWREYIGIFLGLTGAIFILLYDSGQISFDWATQGWYAVAVILGCMAYAANTNWVSHKMKGIPPMQIVMMNFYLIAIPTLIVLCLSDLKTLWQHTVVMDRAVVISWLSVITLAVIGTGTSLVLFYRLLKMSSSVFASSVTYLMPVVAIFWGWLDGESLYPMQWMGSLLIFVSLWVLGKSKKKKT